MKYETMKWSSGRLIPSFPKDNSAKLTHVTSWKKYREKDSKSLKVLCIFGVNKGPINIFQIK